MGEERWMLHTKRADFERIGKQFSVSPVVARIIRNRDVESDEDIRRYLSGGCRVSCGQRNQRLQI